MNNCGRQCEGDKFSIAKIKRGFALLEQHDGASLPELNKFAYMMSIRQDPVALDDAFARIGLNYDVPEWQDKQENIDRAHQWLASFRIGGEPFDALDEEMKSQEGQNYAKLIQADFEKKYSKLLEDCRKQAGDDLRGFYFYFKQDATGRLSNAFGVPSNAMGACFNKGAAIHDKPMFMVPPHADYWNKITVRDH